MSDWISAFANDEYSTLEDLSSMSAERYVHYLGVFNRLNPGGLSEGLTDVDETDDSVLFVFDDGDEFMFDNVVVVDDRVSDFDRNGVPISTMVPAMSGEPNEAAGVTVQVTVVYHRENPEYGTVTYLTVEIDNQSNEDIYGYRAELVGSDRRAVEVEEYFKGTYAPEAISDDVLIFLGSDLSEGGELRIDVDYNTEVRASVPPVG